MFTIAVYSCDSLCVHHAVTVHPAVHHHDTPGGLRCNQEHSNQEQQKLCMFDHKILLLKVFNESIIIFGPPLVIQLGSHGWWDCVGGMVGVVVVVAVVMVWLVWW